MNFLLITIGSHGDVHPFIGLGAGLRTRGHVVTVMTNGHFAPLANRESLGFTELGTESEFLESTNNPKLWSKTAGFKTVMDMVAELTERAYFATVEHLKEFSDTIVIGSSLAMGARIAQDKLGFRMITVHLQPSVLRSLVAPPKLPGMFMPTWMPNFIKRGMWNLADWLVIDPVIAPRLNAFRARVGLPAVHHILRDWWNSPDMIVGMFPAWFAKPQVDWPAQMRVSGFPLYDERGHEPINAGLTQFLAVGDSPIAFTPGSAMRFGHRFFASAIEACGRIGRRAILLSRHREHIPENLPAHAIHCDYAPFSELLPRCAALVHHGGIGTTAQALRAGAAQLIMPLTHDQPDNAAHVRSLGVGDAISSRRFTGRNVAKKLRSLLSDPSIKSRCEDVRNRFTDVDGIALTCDLAESLGNKSHHTANTCQA